MAQHFQFDDSLAEALDLYLLGGLEPEQRAEVAAHLERGCVECRRELVLARTRMAVMALAAPEQDPSPELKRRILQAIAAESEAREQRPAPAHSAAGRSAFGWSWIWGPLAAALALLCLIAYSHVRGLEQRTRQLDAQVAEAQQQMQAALKENRSLRFVAEIVAASATQTIEVKATPAAPHGRAYLNPARGAVLIAENLPPAAPRHTYELWLLPAKGNPIPAGVFQSAANGAAIQAYAQPLRAIAGLAVSLEPAGGSPQPTGPIVLAAKLPAP